MAIADEFLSILRREVDEHAKRSAADVARKVEVIFAEAAQAGRAEGGFVPGQVRRLLGGELEEFSAEVANRSIRLVDDARIEWSIELRDALKGQAEALFRDHASRFTSVLERTMNRSAVENTDARTSMTAAILSAAVDGVHRIDICIDRHAFAAVQAAGRPRARSTTPIHVEVHSGGTINGLAIAPGGAAHVEVRPLTDEVRAEALRAVELAAAHADEVPGEIRAAFRELVEDLRNEAMEPVPNALRLGGVAAAAGSVVRGVSTAREAYRLLRWLAASWAGVELPEWTDP